jgi:hypothetical protein
MKRTYYQATGMTYVAIRVPRELKQLLSARVKASGQPFRYVCQEMIAAFAVRAEDARRADQLDRVAFMATYKDPAGPRIMLWMDGRLSRRLADLADAAHVSRRAFCYTALQRALETDHRRKRS